MHKSYFDIGEMEVIFEGYTDGRHWNGWATPWFTKKVAETMAEHFEDDCFVYDTEQDAFIVKNDNMDEGEYESYEGKDFTIDGETLHLYPIGAWCWIWDNVYEWAEKEGKILLDYLVSLGYNFMPKRFGEAYCGIICGIDGYMSEDEIKTYADGFLAGKGI